MEHAKSVRLHEEARRFLPGGVSSNFRLGMKPVPLFFERAEGARLVDVDGNVYRDYALGMGPAILGHAPAAVVRAVAESLARGQLYAGQHELELALAREMAELVPCAERVRFSVSGSEAVQAAVRVARAFTGRPKVVKFEGHYHGWFDSVFVSVRPEREGPEPEPGTRGQDPGAYENVRVLPWNDLGAVERGLEGAAAVLMEPILCNTGVILPRPGYLQGVRDLCSRRGAVLIFDEVITGFRVGLGGAQGRLGVKPDLAVFAKAMASGFPISCLAGRAEIMDLFGRGEVLHGGTYNGGVPGCAAAVATLRELKKPGVYERIERVGARLMAGLRSLGVFVQGLPAAFNTAFTDQAEVTDYWSYRRCKADLQARFIERLIERGVRVTSRGTWFLSAAHTDEDVDFTLAAARGALA